MTQEQLDKLRKLGRIRNLDGYGVEGLAADYIEKLEKRLQTANRPPLFGDTVGIPLELGQTVSYGKGWKKKGTIWALRMEYKRKWEPRAGRVIVVRKAIMVRPLTLGKPKEYHATPIRIKHCLVTGDE